LVPNLSDFQVRSTDPDGRKARPYETSINLLGRGGVYPQYCCLKHMLLIFLFCFGSTYSLVFY